MTAAFEPPPFCFCAFPLPPDDEARLRDDADEERLAEALLLLLPLFALVLERGLLFEPLLVFDPLPLFEALERLLPELRADPLELDPFELWELRFCLLDDRVFACAITPPWVSDNLGSQIAYPGRDARNALG
jgi:hypothetical protein